jgi:DNA repair protein RecN (Recombination protein N)
VAGVLGDKGTQLDADPARLEQVEQRRAVLTALVRKYADGPVEPGGSGIAAVRDWARRAAVRAAEIDVSDEALAALAARRDEAAKTAAGLAARIGAARAAAAQRLAAAVTDELAGLAMGTARLHVDVRARPVVAGSPTLRVAGTDVGAGPDGTDEVEFRLQPHPDTAPLPLGRGASGGELSRVMLALEVCLAGSADTATVPTLVFDEVDAGVGGRAATEVGRRLARLARHRQVIVVTHLAQVAAYADRQVVVAPAEADGRVLASDVRPVSGAERVAELARMLAGSDSGTAREHAAELLAAARGDRAGARRRAAKPARQSAENARH